MITLNFLTCCLRCAPRAMNAYYAARNKRQRCCASRHPKESLVPKRHSPYFYIEARSRTTPCWHALGSGERITRKASAIEEEMWCSAIYSLGFSFFFFLFFSAQKPLRSEKVARLSYVSSYGCAQRFLAVGWTMYGSTKPAF